MLQLKDDQNDVINQQIRKHLSKRKISISFEYELSNRNFMPDGIRDKSSRLHFYEEFHQKMRDMTIHTWEEFGHRTKQQGYETIPLVRFQKGLQKSMKMTNIVSSDSKLDIIRITKDFRVIGKYQNGVYYILAYDIDFSAYQH